jgi:hypothetical protein
MGKARAFHDTCMHATLPRCATAPGAKIARMPNAPDAATTLSGLTIGISRPIDGYTQAFLVSAGPAGRHDCVRGGAGDCQSYGTHAVGTCRGVILPLRQSHR